MDTEDIYHKGVKAGREAAEKNRQSKVFFGGFVDGFFDIGQKPHRRKLKRRLNSKFIDKG